MRSTIAVAAGLAAVAAASKPTSTVTVDVTITTCDPTYTGNCPYAPTDAADWEDWSSTTSTGCGPKASVTTVTGTNSGKVYSYTKTVTVDTCVTASPVTSASTWADWCGPTETSSVVTGTNSAGKVYSYTKVVTVYPEGCTSTVSATTTTPASTWADWESSSYVDPADPADPTWGDWTSTTAVTTVSVTEGCGVAPTAPPAWISLLPADKSSSIAAEWAGTVGPADWCYWTYSAGIETSVTPVAAVPATSTAVVATYGGSATGVKPAAYTGAANSNAGSLALAGLAAAAVMVIA